MGNTPVEGIPVPMPQQVTGVTSMPGHHSGPIDITRIRVPFVQVVAVVLAIAAGVISIGAIWARTSAHVDDQSIHLNPKEVERGGGVAYKADIRDVKETLRDTNSAEARKTRKLLRRMGITCTKAGSGFSCRVELPEEE